MPNHISNIVRVKDEDDYKKEEEAFEQMQALMKTEDSLFDFNALIPYPDPYKSLDDAFHKAQEEAGGDWSKVMHLKDGYNQGGYEWCCNHWGTKWNAYEIAVDYDTISFQTAWSTPHPIFEELSKRMPGVTIEVEYADEDRGSNCGILTFLDGETIAWVDMSKQKEAQLFARAIIAEQRLNHCYQKSREHKENSEEVNGN